MKKTFLAIGLLFSLLIFPALSWADFVEFPNENVASQATGEESVFNSISFFFSLVMALVFIFSIFGFILSGVTFLVSGGNESALNKARGYLLTSAVGLIISLVGYVSLNLLKHFF